MSGWKGKALVTKKSSKNVKQNYIFLFFVLFGLIFVRYCYYGFHYYYQLDDYIQYHNYTESGQSFAALVKGLGLLSSRPLAGILDIVVWSRLYSNMLAAVAVISAMYAASAVFLHKVFSKQFGTGYLFFVIYALMPLGFEGAYWVSASSRIIVGIFFAALSFYFFDLWCDEGKKPYLWLFAVIQLIAFCFYEQIILFSGALTLIIMLRNIKRRYADRRSLWGFLMFANAAVYFAFTKLAPGGVYGERAKLFLPWQEEYKEKLLTPLLTQLKEVFIQGNAATLGKGLNRGFKLIASEPNFLYILAVLILCAGLYAYVSQTRRENVRFFAELFSGILLAVAPVLLFFVLKDPWFGLRNALISFCGFALIADALFDLVFGRIEFGQTAETVLVTALALLCCISSISELHDYRQSTIADTKIASAAADALEDTRLGDGASVWLLNVNPTYVEDGNLYYHEHDHGATSSAWALTGAITAVSGRTDISFSALVYPISQHVTFMTDESSIGACPIYFYTGDKFVKVDLTKTDDYIWDVVDNSGKVFASLEYSCGGLILKTT